MNLDFLQNLRLQQLFGSMGQTPTFEGAFNPTPPTPDIGMEGMTPPGMPEMLPNIPNQNPIGPDMGMQGGPTTQMQLPPGATPGIAPEGGGLNRIAELMSQLYKPKTESIDKFNELAGQYPEYEEPGKWKKFGAVALGTLGDLYGPEGAGKTAFSEMMNFGRHGRAVADWEKQIDPLKDAANIERQSNTNERMAAHQAVQNQLRDEYQTAQAENNAQKAQLAQDKLALQKFKAENPNMRFDFSGPFVMVADPLTGEVTDTGVPTGSLSDTERLTLGHEQRMTEIGARGAESRATQAAGHEQELVEIGARGEESRETRSTPTGNAAVNRPELPTQTRVRQFNAARELVNSRPELAEFIEIGQPGSNDFKVTAPSTSIFGNPKGPTKAQYDEIIAAIYGEGGAPDTSPPVRVGGPGPAATGGQGQVLRRTVRNRNTGETRVQISTDGGKTWKFEGE